MASDETLVLGIDPGLERTGYGLVAQRDSDLRLVDAGLLRSTRSRDFPRRLAQLREGMEELLNEFSPHVVAVEDLYVHYQYVKTAIIMGHARGVLLLSAGERNIPVVNYPATRIKKSITGNGHASKAQMQRAVQQILGLPTLPEPPDVADALAAAVCHIGTQDQA
jgi:crossover junction endodeoxyribonuclease RuvC